MEYSDKDNDTCMEDIEIDTARSARWKRSNERRDGHPLRPQLLEAPLDRSSVRCGRPSHNGIVESGIFKTTTDTTDFSDELVGVPAPAR